MKNFTKIIATTAIAAAIALGAGGLVFAQQGQGGGMGMQGGGMGMGMHGGGHGGMRGAESAADVTARLATLKTELKITAAQEPAWQKFEAVARQHAESRQAMRTAMQARMQDPKAAAGAASAVDLAAQRDAMKKQRDAQHAERDAARDALYAVLTPEQKTLADQRMRGGRGHGHGHGHHAAMSKPGN